MEGLPITVVDLIAIAIVLISALVAIARGFAHEALSLGAWIGAGFITLYAFPHAQPVARDIIPYRIPADVAAGAVVFLVVLIVLSILARIIAKQMHRSGLGPLDRSLGFLFGILRGFVIVSLLWLLVEFSMTPQDRPGWLQEAKTRPLLEQGAAIIWAMAPADLQEQARDSLGKASDDVKRLNDAQETLERWSAPSSKGGTEDGSDGKDDALSPEQGYKSQQREDMERLIEGVTSGEE